MNRRQFLKRSLLTVAGTAAGLAGWAFLLEPSLPRLERVAVPVTDLPDHLKGYNIGVLADLHLGPMNPASRIRRAAERLAQLKPDLTVVAGDFLGYVDNYEEGQRLIDEAMEPVKGAYGVLGDWDYYRYQLPYFVKPQTAVTILVNQGALVAPGLWLGGVDDGLLGKPHIGGAIAGAPDGAVRILLAHEPDLHDRVEPEHKVALQISGHSHGGQDRCGSR